MMSELNLEEQETLILQRGKGVPRVGRELQKLGHCDGDVTSQGDREYIPIGGI